MFIISWLSSKLGYMPKIDMEVGKVNFEPKIPDLETPTVKKTTTRTKKPTVTAKTARTKKVK
jgi:hypothetical protein